MNLLKNALHISFIDINQTNHIITGINATLL